MSDLGEKLSAYLDGELNAEDARAIEALLESDPDVMTEFESLMGADTAIKAVFDDMAAAPVPMALAGTIRNAPSPVADPRPKAPPRYWPALAAGLAFAVFGGVGGFMVGQSQPQQTQIAQVGWLNDIADYHGIYSQQKRHLVEVPASEADHIKDWLGKTLNIAFDIPDFSDQGLTFQGARLLVAAGQPVSQLIYTDAQGAVYALCQKTTTKAPSDGFTDTTIGSFSMVSWRSEAGDFVVVGPSGDTLLPELAQTVVADV